MPDFARAQVLPPRRGRPRRRTARRHLVGLKVTTQEKRALRWKARALDLWNSQGKLMVGVLLRDYSVTEIVREYERNGGTG